MKAEEFANYIQEIKPSKEALSGKGFHDDVVKLFQSFFDLEKRSSSMVDDPILDLITNWNLETLDIQNIHFNEESEEQRDYIFFGRDAIDDLAIDKKTGAIIAYEMFSGRVTFRCANDSASFLDAVSEIAKFTVEKLTRNLTDDEVDLKSAEVFGRIKGWWRNA